MDSPSAPQTSAQHGAEKVVQSHSTFPLPPDGFNPLTASDSDLVKFGFPRRPNKTTHPLHFAKWEKTLSRPIHRIQPATHPVKAISLPTQIKSFGATRNNNAVAGALLANLIDSAPLNSVSASWVVPNVQPPPSASLGAGRFKDGVYKSGTWIGLDGYGTLDSTFLPILSGFSAGPTSPLT